MRPLRRLIQLKCWWQREQPETGPLQQHDEQNGNCQAQCNRSNRTQHAAITHLAPTGPHYRITQQPLPSRSNGNSSAGDMPDGPPQKPKRITQQPQSRMSPPFAWRGEQRCERATRTSAFARGLSEQHRAAPRGSNNGQKQNGGHAAAVLSCCYKLQFLRGRRSEKASKPAPSNASVSGVGTM